MSQPATASVIRSFFTDIECTRLLSSLLNLNSSKSAIYSDLTFPSDSRPTRCAVRRFSVGEHWDFAFDLRFFSIDSQQQCIFVRLTDSHLSRDNVLVIGAPDENDDDDAALPSNSRLRLDTNHRVVSYFQCGIGDAVVAPHANATCALRSPLANGPDDEFAIIFRANDDVFESWPHFEALPLLVKQRVLAFLDLDTLLAVGCVSRSCRELVDSNVVWHTCAIRRFGKQMRQQMLLLGATWRARFTEQARRSSPAARAEPEYILREWCASEQRACEQFRYTLKHTRAMVQSGFVWFDCFDQLVPLHERYCADITRMYQEHTAGVRKSHVLRQHSFTSSMRFVCRLLARSMSLMMEPAWRELICDAVVVWERDSSLPDHVRCFHGVSPIDPMRMVTLSMTMTHVGQYASFLLDLRQFVGHPVILDMMVVLNRALKFGRILRSISPLQDRCHCLAPKHRLSDYLGLTTAQSNQAVHLMIVTGQLLVIDDVKSAELLSFPLSGLVIESDEAGELRVVTTAGKTFTFTRVANEFIAKLKSRIGIC
jgi:hypothetical protein